MIKFFRKIRWNILNEGRFNRYLAYGLGEIILVAIGILIALQVNNWNQDLNRTAFENKILHEIKSSLELDLLEIQDEIRGMDRIANSCIIIINQLKRPSRYPDSLNRHFAIATMTTHFNPNYTGFRTLQSKGIDLIETDSLRRNISDLYTSSYEYYDQYQQERIHVISSINLKFSDHFYNEPSRIWPYYELAPISRSQIENDPSILANVQLVNFRNWLTNLRARQLERRISKSIFMIEEDLRHRFD